jgi:hypothetical protein
MMTNAVFTKSYFLRCQRYVLPLVLTVILAVAACTETKIGDVRSWGQSAPPGGGVVQSYVGVKLDDGTEVTAWLPEDQALWDLMSARVRNGLAKQAEIKRDGKFWRFVREIP